MTARVLLSAAQNSLARVAAALEEDPLPHFETAIRLVQPHADVPLVARSRRVRELARMGLLPDAAAGLEQELGLIRGEPAGADTATVARLEGQLSLLRKVITETLPSTGQAPSAAKKPPKFSQSALDVYSALDPARQARFIYLDVKSLPRTGLHFMRNTFESLLREHFSFCEWYNEPGCCGQMPCAVTGYATEVPEVPLLRMLKSHDFDLTDPVFPPGGPIRRLILLRDPLYLLTSWWTLHVLYLRSSLLQQNGIGTHKISFAHGPHVVRSAYRILDEEGTLPPVATLKAWLEEKTPYVLGFVDKWAEAARQHPQTCRIVPYSKTPEAVLQALEPMLPNLSPDVQARIEAFRRNQGTLFKARQDPFTSQSVKITKFLRDNAEMFRATADALTRQDRTGLLASAMQKQA
ncbi:hypothetical protein [Neotabrizicola sp. VNH66]|uniref:hypothetical protein n=1 Tax=Neotabrizicola sp. VNH66 TaxID=3400918 RepID=UPI003C0719EE